MPCFVFSAFVTNSRQLKLIMPSDTKQEGTSEGAAVGKDNVGAGGDASPVKRGRGRPKKNVAGAKPKTDVSGEAAILNRC